MPASSAPTLGLNGELVLMHHLSNIVAWTHPVLSPRPAELVLSLVILLTQAAIPVTLALRLVRPRRVYDHPAIRALAHRCVQLLPFLEPVWL